MTAIGPGENGRRNAGAARFIPGNPRERPPLTAVAHEGDSHGGCNDTCFCDD